MANQPIISIIILNTNRKQDTLAALDSLTRQSYTAINVIVLDNNSTDGSSEAIKKMYPQVQLVELEKNLGYAGNNNVGIQVAITQNVDWLLVLNEDTILAPQCLQELIAVGISDPRIGIVGPLVYHFDDPDIIQSAGGKLSRDWQATHLGQNEKDSGQFQTPMEVEWISGCAIMVRRSVIDQVGGLDERFFYYYEETEWCIRARKAGWKIVLVPTAKLWHKGVQINYIPTSNVTYYAARNRLLMLSKHNAPLRARLVAWTQSLKTLISWTFRPRWKHMHSHRDALFQGLSDYMRKKWGQRLV